MHWFYCMWSLESTLGKRNSKQSCLMKVGWQFDDYWKLVCLWSENI